MVERRMCGYRESSDSINSETRQQRKGSKRYCTSGDESRKYTSGDEGRSPRPSLPESLYTLPTPLVRQSTRIQDIRREREARSLALEKAYVHDVYEQISANFSDSRYRPWPRVKQFMMDLEPGSFVCDVGCGSGKYMSLNPMVFTTGADRCRALADIAREKEHEVLICDNLSLPYKDDCFDAVLSIAVIHHIATTGIFIFLLKIMMHLLNYDK